MQTIDYRIVFKPLKNQIAMRNILMRFESEQEFAAWVRENNRTDKTNKTQTDKTIAHEKAHFEKASSLGYKPYYAIECFPWLKKDTNPKTAVVRNYLVEYDGERPQAMDHIEILLAPLDPSIPDLEAVNSIMNNLRIGNID